MKILFLADLVFEDQPGGSRVVARELASGLVHRGHDVTFLVRAKGAEASSDTVIDGARVVRFAAPKSARGYIRAGKEACARLLAESPYDVVHTHFAYGAYGPLKVLPKCIPYVRSFYGPWHEEGQVEDRKALAERRVRIQAPAKLVSFGAAFGAMHLKYRLRSEVERQNLRRSQMTIVLSEQSRGEVHALGFGPERIVKIAGGVDTERFTPPEDKGAVRIGLGLPTDQPVLLSIRRLAPRMGLDNLIRAMSAVVARQPKTLLLIGGQGPERAHLEALISALGLAQNVWMLGFIPDDKLVSYYQAADAFVLPTVALEGFGLVTTEALACGVPVLGTNVGATPEILSLIDARMIVPGSSAAALSASILDFLEGTWRQELTQARLRQVVVENFQWDRHVEAVERIYLELTGQ